jgi:predicted nucleic-acid-binding protein
VIAVDTNIVVRYLVEDDPIQTDRAEAMLRSGAVLVPTTVLLETAWVLRSSYRFERTAIVDGITKLLGLPGVEFEDSGTAGQGARLVRAAGDFADALHLASSGRAEAFATFDPALRRRARAVRSAIRVVAP